MPAWRKLHTKITESLVVNDFPDDFTRLVWVLLPLGLDREGRGLDNPAWIKAKVMPLRTDVSLEQFSTAMVVFAERGLIVRYEVGGQWYFEMAHWHKQQGDTSRETDSDFPAPGEVTPAQSAEPTGSETIARPDPLPSNSQANLDLLMSSSRVSHDLLMTNSCLDSDSELDSDADSDADSDSPAPPAQTGPTEPVDPIKMSSERDDPDPLILYQKSYELTRLTPAQESTLRALAAQYGAQRLYEVIAWATDAGIPQARALRAIQTALPGWRSPERSSRQKDPPPRRRRPIDELIERYQQNNPGGKPWPPALKSLQPLRPSSTHIPDSKSKPKPSRST